MPSEKKTAMRAATAAVVPSAKGQKSSNGPVVKKSRIRLPEVINLTPIPSASGKVGRPRRPLDAIGAL